jgi:triacylglycerol lipase
MAWLRSVGGLGFWAGSIAGLAALAPGALGCGTAAGASVSPDADAGSPGSPSEQRSSADAGRGASKDPHQPAPPVVIHQRGASGPYPIVLMHGMAGFNTLANLPVDISYFNGVQADLEAHGVKEVFVTVAPPYATSEDRAASLAPQLAAILKQTGAAKLNLIGHSQGGLDARVLVSPAGMDLASEVATVTTIATPHRGTPVADLAMGVVSATGPLEGTEATVANAFLNLLEQGVYTIESAPNIVGQATEMTTPYMASTFNPKYVDAYGVVYASYAGRTNLESGEPDCDDAVYANQPGSLDVPQVELQATATYLQTVGDTSDGLVPVTSAKWGTFLECVPADHLKEVGLIDQNGADPVSGYDHLAFFRAVVARLRAQGF